MFILSWYVCVGPILYALPLEVANDADNSVGLNYSEYNVENNSQVTELGESINICHFSVLRNCNGCILLCL